MDLQIETGALPDFTLEDLAAVVVAATRRGADHPATLLERNAR
jgi:hypothetical protein